MPGLWVSLVVAVLLVAGYVGHSHAHLCLVNPIQRGPLPELNHAASPSCFQLAGPCGNETAEQPQVEVTAGSLYTVVFQKNLNHWQSGDNSGRFKVYFAPAPGKQFVQLATVADSNTPSLTLYTIPVKIPSSSIDLPNAVLQVVYAPVGVGPFYQCSDIAVHRSSSVLS